MVCIVLFGFGAFENKRSIAMKRQLPQAVKPNRNGRITLHAESQGDGLSAIIAVRWCVCPSLLTKLKKRAKQEPYLLLVITRDGSEQERRCVPLQQTLEYISFRSPGEYQIQATIVRFKKTEWGAHRFLKTMRDVVDYKGKLLSSAEFQRNWRDNLTAKIGYGHTTVNVAPQFFAERPRNWVWNWVNLWRDQRPVDECHFRRRAFYAFSLQPFVVLIWLVATIIFRLLAAGTMRYLLGARGIDFAPAWHPWQYSYEDMWHEFQCSNAKWFFTTDSKGEERFPFLCLFSPASLLGFTLLACILDVKWGSASPWSLAWGLLVAPGLFALIISACFILAVLEKIFPNAQNWRAERAKRKKKAARLARRQQWKETYEPLVCQGSPLRASLDAIPKQQRTLYLRYMDLKARVCKPFAR